MVTSTGLLQVKQTTSKICKIPFTLDGQVITGGLFSTEGG